MAEPLNFAVIPTNGRACFKDCLLAIEPQVDEVIVVESGCEPGKVAWVEHPWIQDPDLNISKWWNRGLEMAELLAKGAGAPQWNVAILNDDTIVPTGWMSAVTAAMRQESAAAACSGGTAVPHQTIHREPGPVGLMTRMKGFAFTLAGEKGIRANEQLRWYFSDDHVDWMARKLGGMVVIPGYNVEHLYPNGQVTPEMHQIIAEDGAAFTAYWGGMRPW